MTLALCFIDTDKRLFTFRAFLFEDVNNWVQRAFRSSFLAKTSDSNSCKTHRVLSGYIIQTTDAVRVGAGVAWKIHFASRIVRQEVSAASLHLKYPKEKINL